MKITAVFPFTAWRNKPREMMTPFLSVEGNSTAVTLARIIFVLTFDTSRLRLTKINGFIHLIRHLVSDSIQFLLNEKRSFLLTCKRIRNLDYANHYITICVMKSNLIFVILM